jgi:hypothetical protein
MNDDARAEDLRIRLETLLLETAPASDLANARQDLATALQVPADGQAKALKDVFVKYAQGPTATTRATKTLTALLTAPA